MVRSYYSHAHKGTHPPTQRSPLTFLMQLWGQPFRTSSPLRKSSPLRRPPPVLLPETPSPTRLGWRKIHEPDRAIPRSATPPPGRTRHRQRLNYGSYDNEHRPTHLSEAHRSDSSWSIARQRAFQGDVHLWDEEEVATWLCRVGLIECVASFRAASIDGAGLLGLTPSSVSDVLQAAHHNVSP